MSTTTIMLERKAEISPRLVARMAGGSYVLAVATATIGENLLHGNAAVAMGFLAVACMAGLTGLFYILFRPVNPGLSLFAAGCNCLCLALEALRWNPDGIDMAVAFHGV